MRSTRFRLHVGIEGGREEREREGGKGVEGGKVAVGVLHGRVGRVSAGAIALLSLRGNSTQAREQGNIHVNYTTHLPLPLPFLDNRGPCHRLLEVASRGLIIKYFLDNCIAASTFIWGNFVGTTIGNTYFCLNCASNVRGSPSSVGTLRRIVFQTECHAPIGRDRQTSSRMSLSRGRTYCHTTPRILPQTPLLAPLLL